MYFNDIHILVYALFGVLGLAIGQFVDWMNKRLPEHESIFSKDIFDRKVKIKPNYILMVITAIIYIVLLYFIGIQNEVIGNVKLILYLVLTPMLLSAFVIDYKMQIIPNRLNLAMFEIGLIAAFIYGLDNINITIDRFLGMFAGAAIFGLITAIGGFIAGKEAMGLGDVKLMGALGICFGLYNIVIISVIAFLVGAILSIILLVTKIKKTDEYIPFGPFIVIATFITMLIPFNTLLGILLTVLTLGFYKM